MKVIIYSISIFFHFFLNRSELFKTVNNFIFILLTSIHIIISNIYYIYTFFVAHHYLSAYEHI